MDSEKPKPDPPSDSPSDSDSARRRVERLTAADSEDRGSSGTPTGHPGDTGSDSDEPPSGGRPSSSSTAGGSGGPPRLTERQRIEAREKRRNERRGRKNRGRHAGAKDAPGAPGGNPLSRGIRATLLEVRRTAGFLWGLVLSGLERLGPALRLLVSGLVALLTAAGGGLSKIGRAIAAGLARIGTALLALDRVITPRRALIAVAGGAVLALIASQFTDFRATEIGQAGYDPILDITRAPRTDVITPVGAHSILLLLAAGGALAALAGLALTGRRVFAAAIAGAGAITIAVTLLIDLPRGLDTAEAEISYSEVAAVLLSGFWIQLGAGLVLAFGGLGLLMLSGQRRRNATGSGADTGARREQGRQGKRRPRPADAGGFS